MNISVRSDPEKAPYDLAPYASYAENSRGRLHEEAISQTRTIFQRDRDRVIHSTAFRRLKQKTQVFVAHEGDHYRTRLTHSLEVAQIARSMARTLRLDEDLAETLALAHDIGHPPFGHAGEDALDEVMADFGGFDHNAQALRVVTQLEDKYPDFDGLNLSWETLEGLVKHNGPLIETGQSLKSLNIGFRDYPGLDALELHTHAGLEAQLAALADDIAYNNHDIDDGLHAGLFHIEELYELPLIGDVFREVKGRYPTISRDRQSHEAIRRLIGFWIDDVVTTTLANLKALKPASVNHIREAKKPVAAFSESMAAIQKPLRAFLFERMYKHTHVAGRLKHAKNMLVALFGCYMQDSDILPTSWAKSGVKKDETDQARLVCDYVAGMTDHYVIEAYEKLIGKSEL